MKRLLLTTTLIIAFAIVKVNAQSDTLAGWTFPNGELADTLAEFSSANNQDAYLKAVGTSSINMKNGVTTKAAQVTGWDSGTAVKYWQVTINTSGYENIKIWSKQSSGGKNPGPRDFAVVYSIGDTEKWSKLDGSDIDVQNDWTSGVIDGLSFPGECENVNELHIKWTMTTDTASDGKPVQENGISKIDDIFFTADVASSIHDHNSNDVSIFPNPAQSHLFIKLSGELSIYSMNGKLLYKKQLTSEQNTIDMSGFPRGMYILHVQDDEKQNIQKLILE